MVGALLVLTLMVKSYKLRPSMPTHGKAALLVLHQWLTQFYLVQRNKEQMHTLHSLKRLISTVTPQKVLVLLCCMAPGFVLLATPSKNPKKIVVHPNSARTQLAHSLSRRARKISDGFYEGGSDSGCYNYMENIALRTRVPTLPGLGTKISTALRPSAVGSDFHTGRINWTIQSSGAEMLAILLTATHWLARQLQNPCSVHPLHPRRNLVYGTRKVRRTVRCCLSNGSPVLMGKISISLWNARRTALACFFQRCCY